MTPPIVFMSISKEEARAKIAKAIVLGFIKGIVQYLLVFISLSTILDYLSKVIAASTGASVDLSSVPISIKLDIMLLIMFVSIAIISSLLKEFILYGPVLASILFIILLYVVFVKFGWGVIDLAIDSLAHIHLDLSPLFEKIFMALVLILLGGGFTGLAKNLSK